MFDQVRVIAQKLSEAIIREGDSPYVPYMKALHTSIRNLLLKVKREEKAALEASCERHPATPQPLPPRVGPRIRLRKDMILYDLLAILSREDYDSTVREYKALKTESQKERFLADLYRKYYKILEL